MLLALLLGLHAQAQAATSAAWDGDQAPNTNISTGANWVGGSVPSGNGAVATFPNVTNRTATSDTVRSIDTLTFTADAANPYLLNGSSVLTISGFNQNGAGAHTISAPLALGGTVIFGGTGGGTITISGVLSGSGNDLTLNNSALTLILSSGANTYTGVTNITAGTLSIATVAAGGSNSDIGASAAAASNLVLAGGTLKYTGPSASTNRAFTVNSSTNSTFQVTDANATLTFSGQSASTSGALTKTGAGTLALDAANQFSGNITITAGTLSTNTLANGGANSGIGCSTNAATSLVLNGGNLGYSGASTSCDRSFTINAGTTGGFDVSNANTSLTISGQAAATTGALTKLGAGTLVFTGAHQYTGATTLSAGTLSVSTLANGGTNSGIGASGNGAANLVFNGGTLKYTGTAVSIDRNFTLGAGSSGTIEVGSSLTISGASASTNGALIKSGAGSLILSGANQHSGTTTVGAGSLLVNGSLAAGSAVTVANGAILGGTGTIDGAVSLAAGGILDAAGAGSIGTLTLAAASPLSASAGGVLHVDINGAGTCDLVNLSSAGAGSVSLNNIDLTVSATSPSGSYTILSFPSGAVTGAFRSLPPGISATYNATSVTISGFTARYWIGGSQPATGMSASPAALFALRRLRGAYPGPAIRVHRSSDGAELDIGFTSTGLLDQSTLTAFIGSSNGTVSVWYDQSGNGRDAVQGTVASQPTIVSSGAVQTQDGRPTLNCASGPRYLQAPTMGAAMFNNVAGGTLNVVANNTVNFSPGSLANQGRYEAGNWWGLWAMGNAQVQNGLKGTGAGSSFGAAPAGVSWIISSVQTGATGTILWINGTNAVSTAGGNYTVTTPFWIGHDGVNAEDHHGTISEVTVWTSGLSATDRNTLEFSQSNYFGISATVTTPVWSSTANWAYTSGGPAGAPVPTVSEAVYFDGNGIGSCSVDASVSVASLTMSSGYTGALAFGANTITTAGSVDLRSGGSFTGTTGGLVMNGGGAQTLIPPAGASIPNFTKSGAGTTTLSTNALSVAANLAISAGCLASGNQNISVAGNWSNSVGAGGFTAGTAAVTLNGAGGSTQVISGSTTFNNLSASCSTARTINFTAGTTQTVNGALSLNGASGQLLSLRSTATPSTWTLTPNGTRSCSFLDVKDGINTVGPAIGPALSVNSGNNTLWFLPARYWVGRGANNLWSNAANWASTSGGSDAVSVPGSTDKVVFDGSTAGGASGTKACTVDCASDAAGTVAAWDQAAAYTGIVTFNTTYAGAFQTFTISGNATLYGGTWSHAANTNAKTNRLKLAIGGNLTVASGAAISANSLGYTAGNGTGAGNANTKGGAYGGRGGNGGGQTYGDATQPDDLGSSTVGGGTGGGAIQLAVTGTATVNGTISANAAAVGAGVSSGAGGSLVLSAAGLSGTGTISAYGGSGAQSGYACGGGGRVALTLGGSLPTTLALGAVGGWASGGLHGAAGSIYVRENGEALGAGTLIYDNSTLSTPSGGATQSALDDSSARTLSVGSLIVRGNARLEIGANDSLSTSTTRTQVPTTSGLLCHLPFDEGTGVQANSTVNGHVATLNGATGWTTGRLGASALKVNSNGAYTATARLPDSVSWHLNQFTMSFWIRLDRDLVQMAALYPEGPANEVLNVSGIYCGRLSGAADYSWGFRANRAGSSNTVQYTTEYNAGSWVHLAFVRDASNMTIYRNGAQVAQAASGAAMVWANNALALGGGLDGAIDDFRIYDSALNGGEVYKLLGSSGSVQLLGGGNINNTGTLNVGGTGTTLTVASDGYLWSNGSIQLAGTSFANDGDISLNHSGSVVTYTGQAGNPDVSMMPATYNTLKVNRSGTVFRVPAPVAGRIKDQIWDNAQSDTGSAVANLTGNANYPDNCSWELARPNFEGWQNLEDNYASRIRGWLIPPTTGGYQFWIASDDCSELWLSTDASPANKVRIAYVTAATGYRIWTVQANQASAAIQLVAGQRYYIEALHKEAGSGDYLSVKWQLPSAVQEIPIPADRIAEVSAVTSLLHIQAGTLDLSGHDLICENGPFTCSNDDTLRLQGGEVLSGFTNDTDSGTVIYNGSGDYYGLAAGSSYFNLRFAGTSGARTWTQQAALSIAGSLTIDAGNTLQSDGNNVTVAGNWSNQGTYSPGAASVPLTMSCTDGAATIRYTTDGSAPTAGSTAYAGQLMAAPGTVVKATAYNGGSPSASPVQILVGGSRMSQGLVGNWPLDANGNDALGVSNGTTTGTVTYSSGRLGNAAVFNYADGDDYISIANTAATENVQEGNYTVCAWFRPDSIPPGTVVSDNTYYYGILIKTGDHIGLAYSHNTHMNATHVVAGQLTIGGEGSATPGSGSFHHFAMTLNKDAGSLRRYADGAADGEVTFTAGTAAYERGTSNWQLGIAGPGYPDWKWAAQGAVDDARIYSRILSPSEIAWLAASNNGQVTIPGAASSTNTVTLNGAGGSTQVISGNTSFSSLTATCAAARTLQFAAGSTQTVNGTLTLQGASGQLLSLRSTASPSTWTLTPNGTRTCSFVDVMDGINTVAPAIDPASSLNAGNTVQWFSVTPATKLAVTTINGGSSPTVGTTFTVVVQAQDVSSVADPVVADTAVTLSRATGTGVLGGTLTGTILAGQSSVTISGVTYDVAETGVSLTATRTSGDTLTAGTSATFTVLDNNERHWNAPAAGNWTSTANWAWVTDGTIGAPVPGSADAVFFDVGSTNNCTVNCAADATVASWTQTAAYTGTVTFATTYAGAFQTLTISGNAMVNAGTWTHSDNSTAQTYRLNVVVGGDLTLAAAAWISADHLGYDKSDYSPGGVQYDYRGGSHGGRGGRTMGNAAPPTYGDPKAPIAIGGGGSESASWGGGAIRIAVGGISSIAGTITCNGYNGDGAGAGGSVFITTGSISGAGTIRANGGSHATGGAGGGGRVAVLLTAGGADFSGFTGSTTAYGGIGSYNVQVAGAGTVYRQTTAQGANGGDLIFDNNGTRRGDGWGTGLDDAGTRSVTVGRVITTGAARLEIGADDTLILTATGTSLVVDDAATLTNLGTLSISGTASSIAGVIDFTAVGNSVIFTGQSNDAAVTMPRVSYHHLSVANAGTTFAFNASGIWREVWNGIGGGTSVSDLTSHPAFPNAPSSTGVASLYFEGPVDADNQYGSRMRAMVTPPTTGNYRFWIASDDNSELWVAADGIPGNAVKVAWVANYTNPREWTVEANQQSADIPLTAGQPCYVMALHKEGGGGDHLAVGWTGPSSLDERPIPSSRCTPYGASAVSIAGNLTISSGTLNGSACALEVAGNWSNSGTFTPGTQTVSFTGARGSTQTISGDTTFYDLNKSVPTPASISGCQLWLDASNAASITSSGGLVSQWNDLSGNGRHVSQGSGTLQPALVASVINGLPVLRFDGSDDYLDNATFSRGSTPGTYFLVERNLGGGVGAAPYSFGGGSTNNSGILYQNNGGMQPANAPRPAYTSASARCWSMTQTYAGGYTLYADGVAVPFDGASVTTGSLIAPFEVGRRNVGAVCTSGDIAEIVVYDRALNASERQLVEAYLMSKWSASPITSSTLQFAAGSTQSVAGTLTLQGSDGHLLSLVSTTPGATWYVDPQGTRTCSYLAVTDGTNLRSPVINPTNSTNVARTVLWFASGSDRYWVGRGGDAYWSTLANWASTSGGLDQPGVPGPANNVFFDGNTAGGASGNKNCTVDGNGLLVASWSQNGYTGTVTFAHPYGPDGGTGEILHWGFDEDSGLVARDQTGSGAVGALTNMTGSERGAGRWGRGLALNASDTDDRVVANLPQTLAGDCSVTAWIRFVGDASVNQPRVIDLAQAADIGIQLKLYMNGGVNPGMLGLENSGGPTSNVLSSAACNDGLWHHVAVTRSGTTYTLYVDGVSAGSSGGTAPTYTRIFAGCRSDGLQPATCDIDEVRVWSRALGTTEISGLAAPGLAIAGDCTLGSGTWTHANNSTTQTNRMHVAVGAGMTIGSGASINVEGRGFASQQGSGYIYGAGYSGGTFRGAGHGGIGGRAGGRCYGDPVAPFELGSGGQSGSGGGAVRLVVAGAFTVDGTISARSLSADGAGSGGSLFISAGALDGGGTIAADGASHATGGCGGGGRIAVILPVASGFNGTLRARGGVGGSTYGCAAAGTIYLEAQGPGTGNLLIDNGGTVTQSPMTTDIDGSGARSVSVGTVTVSGRGQMMVGADDSLTVTGTGTTVTVAANCGLTNQGTLTLGGSAFSMSGSANFTTAGNVVNYLGQADDAGVGLIASSYQTLTVNNSGTVFSQGGSTTVAAALTVTAGIYDLAGTTLVASGATVSNSDTIRLQGGETVTGFVNDTDSGAVVYNGTGAYAALAAGNSYYDLSFAGASGARSWTHTGTLDVNRNLSIAAGNTLATGTTNNLTVAGNWSNAGTYTCGTGTSTVTLDGAGAQSLGGSTTFNNLTASGGGRTITWPAGATQTVNGALTLTGAGTTLTLVSSNPGTRWSLDPKGTRTCSELSVQDGWNLRRPVINPASSADVDNNLDWFAAAVVPTLCSPVHNPDDAAAWGHTLNIRPALIWQVQSGAGAGLHYRVLLDQGAGTTQVADSASDQTGFAYYDGAAWQAMPAGGVPSALGTRFASWRPGAGIATGAQFWSVREAVGAGVSAAAAVRRFRIATPPWSADTTLAAGKPIRVVHVSELRSETDAVRAFRNDGVLGVLPAISWTDDPLVALLTQIRKTHLDQLRSALLPVKAVTGASVVIAGDAITAGQTQIRADHFLELRTALEGL